MTKGNNAPPSPEATADKSGYAEAGNQAFATCGLKPPASGLKP